MFRRFAIVADEGNPKEGPKEEDQEYDGDNGAGIHLVFDAGHRRLLTIGTGNPGGFSE